MSGKRATIVVDGQVFSVVHEAAEGVVYHFEWLNSIASGYGFSVRRSSGEMSAEECEEAIRRFLAQIDPRSQRLP